MTKLLFLFQIGDRMYALVENQVAATISEAAATPIPGGASWLEGFVDSRGETIPLIDVRSILSCPPPTQKEEREIILVAKVSTAGVASKVAFRIDKIFGAREVSLEDIVPISSAQTGIETGLSGLYSIAAETYGILDLDKVLSMCYQQRDTRTSIIEDRPIEVATFRLGNSEWAVPLARIAGTKQTGQLLKDHLMPTIMIGSYPSDRARTPVIDLRILFSVGSNAATKSDEDCCLFMERADGLQMACAVSSLGEITVLSEADRDPHPHLHHLLGDRHFHRGFYRKDERLIELVDPDLLIDPANLARIQAWKTAIEAIDRLAGLETPIHDESTPLRYHPLAKELAGIYAIARVNDVLLAFDAIDVAEMVHTYRLIPVPGLQGSTSSVFSHRGTTHPVLRLRQHLSLSNETSAVPSSVLLVLTEERGRLALEVDAVAGMTTALAPSIKDRVEFKSDVHPKLLRACVQTEFGLAGIVCLDKLRTDRDTPLAETLRRMNAGRPLEL